MALPEKMSDGRYPALSWPGGYPIYYMMRDGGVMCAPCANNENGSLAKPKDNDPQWDLWSHDVHWEGEPLECCHCNATIDSAYGVPDGEETGRPRRAGVAGGREGEVAAVAGGEVPGD